MAMENAGRDGGVKNGRKRVPNRVSMPIVSITYYYALKTTA